MLVFGSCLHFIIDNFIVDKVPSTRSGRASLTTVLITASLDAAGMGLVMPILPALLSDAGVPTAQVPLNVGILIALYAIMQCIFAPILGRLSDRFGRRRILLASLAGATIDYLVLATTSTLWVFYVARAIAGITGATNAVTATVIADTTPPHERAKRFGLLSACYGGGMIAGPALGGVFGAISPHLPFLLAAFLSATNLLLSFFLLRETRPNIAAGFDSPFKTHRSFRITAIPGVSFLLIAFGLVQFIGQAPGSTWVLFTENRLAWGPVEIGISLSAFGVIQVIVQAALTGRLVERIGESNTAVLGFAADAVGLLGLAAVTNAWGMLPILAALGVGSISLPALQTMLSQRVNEEQQGRLQGALASINSITSIFGPIAFTVIFTLTHLHADGSLWLCAAALYIPCFVLAVRGGRTRRPKKPHVT